MYTVPNMDMGKLLFVSFVREKEATAAARGVLG